MKKLKKFNPKKFISIVLWIIILLLAYQILGVLFFTPILAVYGYATNLYALNGDASYFKFAAQFTIGWFKTVIAFLTALLIYQLIKILEKKKKNGRK